MCEPSSVVLNLKTCEGEILLHNNNTFCRFALSKPQSYLLHVVNSTFYGAIFDPVLIEIFHKNGTYEKLILNNTAWLDFDGGSTIVVERIVWKSLTKL